jgi:hypothetical protein
MAIPSSVEGWELYPLRAYTATIAVVLVLARPLQDQGPIPGHSIMMPARKKHG